MLTLILGRAKSGKTARVMDEIARRVRDRRGGNVLLVPEQYSHEAETELLRVCGDSLSLYAEVLSFTRLAARVEAEVGAPGAALLDPGGRLLCMSLAVDAVGSRLKLYGAARRQVELQSSLLATLDELKSACIGVDDLREAAGERSDVLGDKLRDLSLIWEAYEAVLGQSRLDPMDRLRRLAEQLGESSLRNGFFCLDGFTDLTGQERTVVEAMLAAGADVQVCLTCESLEETQEIFESSRRAALALQRTAERLGVPCRIETMDPPGEESPLAFLERELFSFADVHADAGDAVRLTTASSLAEECEAAAERCLTLVREGGCRWRDIAVAVRGYEAYRPTLESVFARYGIPLYSAGKSDVVPKPLAALLTAAFAVVSGGWDYEDVFAYAKTALAGLNREECDTLENYAFLWSIRGSAWTREEDWHMHPDGYDGDYTDEVNARLREINALRRRLAGPLDAFARAGREAETALAQAQALAGLMEALALPERLAARAGELRELGMDRQAAETEQLWDVAVNALEQCAGILGEMPMDQESFGRLFLRVLSQYDVGTIPLSLDKVSAGDMDRMRRRHLRHLLVLGCDSEHVPAVLSGGGVLTDDDRETLLSDGIKLGEGAEDRLCHEFALLYNCLTLPSDTLTLSYSPAAGESGEALPAFLMSRAAALFSLPIVPADLALCRASAPLPAMDLAAQAASRPSPLARAARRYLSEHGQQEALHRLDEAAHLSRGSLSRRAVRALYGDKLRLSASRIDRFAACRFSYFLQYGLKAKPRQAASFSPPEMGTFMHFVLERSAAVIRDRGGFAAVTDEEIAAVTDEAVAAYVHEKLNDFREKSPRFVYLFRRLGESVRRVVTDMAHELARSDFQPLDFELNFAAQPNLPGVELGDGDEALQLTGIADRVDGWYHEGKLYLRVVDYKTGRKAFSLSDVWYGMGLQMLLYLFALEKGGASRYGAEIVPAGVLYVPARDVLLSAKAEMSDEEILEKKAKALCRKGLLLADDAVLHAMEHGESPCYLPVTYKNGSYSGDALSTAEQLGQLSRHIEKTLRSLAGELRRGSIAADPYFRTQSENACALCDYQAACHFDENADERRYLPRLKAAQVWEKLAKGDEET